MKTAAYVRVSSVGQNLDGQRRELERWLSSNGISDVRWFADKVTGSTLDRPEFNRLEEAIQGGEIATVVVWKVDRLSRSLRDGVNVLADWCGRGVRVVSVTQGFDFNGASGRMLAALLLGLAEMENEARRERQAIGISAAKARGGVYKGRKAGSKSTATLEREAAVRALRASGRPISEIARLVDLSRPTVRSLLQAAGGTEHPGYAS